MKKDFLRLSHLTKDDGWEIIERSKDLKIRQENDIKYTPLSGRTLAMVFEKPSTRTRVSFETGIYQLGGQGIYLSSTDLQLSRGESVADTARVISGYVDMVMIRAFSQEMVEEFATHVRVPVINGLTDLLHPCQVMSDIFTIVELRGGKRDALDDVNVVYIGDGNNMVNSWINGAVLFGLDLTLSCPDALMPDGAFLEIGKEKLGEKLKIIHDPEEAVSDATIVYTDTWVSMGDEKKREKKLNLLKAYQVNDELLKHAPKEVKVMHCLPAHRGEEITDSVMDSERSIVWQQAENRLHVQKAIMDILNQQWEEKRGR